MLAVVKALNEWCHYLLGHTSCAFFLFETIIVAAMQAPSCRESAAAAP